MASIITEWIRLETDATPMEAYLATPNGQGPWPAVLVLMEIFGVNAHIRSVTERLAEKGYVALAINYYHRTTPNMELAYDAAGTTEGRKHKDATTRDGLLADINAALDYLGNRPDVRPQNQFGTIGFCFGGHVAYLAATLPRVAATASFYGGGIATMTPGGGEPTLAVTPDIHGKILCLFGLQDPLIPRQDVDAVEQALRQAGTTHEVVRYPDAGHGFFCEARPDYRPDAASDAWKRVLALFSETLNR